MKGLRGTLEGFFFEVLNESQSIYFFMSEKLDIMIVAQSAVTT